MKDNNQNQPLQLSRRQFLGQASCAALGTTGLFSTLLNLRLTRAVAAADLLPGNDYKALVCIFQAGGNDSYNMLVPTSTDEYNQYAAVRGDIALQKPFNPDMPMQSGIMELSALGTGGSTFGVHPAMSEIHELFNQGHLAFVANTGTLIEPLTVQQYRDNEKRIPRSLFSHNDQISQWQTSVPQENASSGWAGRMADILHDSANDSAVSMNISLSGNNIWQTGGTTTFYTITPNGSVSLLGNETGASIPRNLQSQLVSQLIGVGDEEDNSPAGELYRNLFEQSYAAEFRDSVELDLAFADAFDDAFDDTNLTTHFTLNNPLSQDLKAVAQTIAARNTLQMRRQVFFVITGGWDHHQELIETQFGMLRGVSSAMKEFWDVLNLLGVQDDVITFTASDFGRTLRSNGRGTDHAWGGNHMVMGGPVDGQRIWGAYPTAGEMRLNDGLDVGSNGRLLPTTSVDQYMAELALWFGAPPAELGYVFPNINNFYDPQLWYSGHHPVGFLTPVYPPQ